jgi:hypothetical protein
VIFVPLPHTASSRRAESISRKLIIFLLWRSIGPIRIFFFGDFFRELGARSVPTDRVVTVREFSFREQVRGSFARLRCCATWFSSARTVGFIPAVQIRSSTRVCHCLQVLDLDFRDRAKGFRLSLMVLCWT